MTAQSASLSWVPPKSWDLSLCGVFIQLGLNCSPSPAQVCTHPASYLQRARASWPRALQLVLPEGFSLLSPIPTKQILS